MKTLKTYRSKSYSTFRSVIALLFVLSGISMLSAQVTSKVDSLATSIGAQLQYEILAEVDSTATVVFPEKTSFIPFEVVSESATDSILKKGQTLLRKQYTLTQFDSGRYIIPRQRILVNKRAFFTDSFNIHVKGVLVDTTKQKMFDIKPIIAVEKPSDWRLLYWFLGISAMGALGYWFLWGKSRSTKSEAVLLPPYEQAMQALKKLDDPTYIKELGLKTYYSELTFVLRQYLDQKVLDNALESTTEEIMAKLRMFRDAKKLVLSNETLANFETVLQRADLVKFAKSEPDFYLAEADKNTVAAEIKIVKEKLPVPKAADRFNDPAFLAAMAKKKKKKKQLKASLISLGFLLLILTGLVFKYGATNIIDTISRNPSKSLLESSPWITSEYGAPGIILSTPKVLKRNKREKDSTSFVKSSFVYENNNIPFHIKVINSRKDNMPQGEKIDVLKLTEEVILKLEKDGAKNIITKNESFITPGNQEGLKTSGTADMFINNKERLKMNFVHLGFTSNSIAQELLLLWPFAKDPYADQIVDKILSSVELFGKNKKKE